MPASFSSSQRVTVDGKFFRLGTQKFFVKGVTYGPFAPNPNGEPWPGPEQTARDFSQINDLGANLLRLYYVPPAWFLDLAAQHNLKLLVDVPWPKHVCFFETYSVQGEARRTVRDAVTQCRSHPAVFAFSVANEIPAEIVRWSGHQRVARFIDELIREARNVDPQGLYTFASFPPTEYLAPRETDFSCFNVYLEQPLAFERYLARLQSLAESKPLLLGEFGLDSLRHGEQQKCELLKCQIEAASRAGLAGAVLFSYTDDWYRGGQQVEGWEFGLTARDRRPKPSFNQVRQLYCEAPGFPLPRYPRVSVVVASYNGDRTLDACLRSLCSLNYPDVEVILVDDGSTDNTQEIAERFPTVRILRQPNLGLSAARNAGIKAATGEIVAFTDSDCRADEDWLFHLIGELVRGDFVGVGGHNFLPPEDSPVAAAVLVSPGGPAHVMLTDQEAEHIPGCNMAFYKWALEEINGFDPLFRKAGDDVDVCWRLLERGYKLGFSPAGFVWHYRRSSVKAYLKQQAGYGEAEALLVEKHPEYFNSIGGGIWRGRIYAASRLAPALRPGVIYHGIFGSGFFQKLYQPPPAHMLMMCASLPYHVFVNLPLLALAFYSPLLMVPALASVVASLAVCVMAALQADLPRNKTRIWSRPLVAWLFLVQPIVRGWARYSTRLNLRYTHSPRRTESQPALEAAARSGELSAQLCYLNQRGIDRFTFLRGVISALESSNCRNRLDSGWEKHDLAIIGNRWTDLKLITVNEFLEDNKIFLRCRLRARWSAAARLLFLFTMLSVLLLINYLHQVQPMSWMTLLALPLIAWFIDDENRFQGLKITRLVEKVAQELHLQHYESASAS